MVGKSVNNSISFPSEIWDRIDLEAKQIGSDRSNICLLGVKLYFSHQKKDVFKHNFTQIILGVILALVVLLLVLVVSYF